LASDEAVLRYEAARALGVIGSDAAVPELLAVMDGEEDVEVRHAAIAALGAIGGRAAVRALRTRADHAEEADEEMIEAALEEATADLDDADDRR
jgi:HEAT repeat protein